MPGIANKRTRTVAIAAAVAALATGISACGKTQNAQALLAEAQQYRQKGDDKAAIIQLKNALQKNPEDAEARFLLGSVHNDAGDPQSAEKELRKAVSLGMNPDRVMSGLARALLAQGQFQKLLDETQQAAGTNGNAEILSLRGNAWLGLGKHQEARESFEQALKSKADFPNALIGLARLALGQKDFDRAIRLTEQAISANPKHAESWLFKGDILRAQGKIDAALAAYDEVLKIKPGNAAAHLVKAYVEIGAGKFNEARADIDAARKSAPDNLSASYTQALLDYSQKKHAAALESLQQVLRVAPDHMPSVLLAGAVQYALGSTQQAEQHLKKYLDSNPANLYARKLLASALLKNSQPQRAINVLGPALKDPQQDAELLLLAGESHMQVKDYGKATEYFEKAGTLSPQNAGVHTALAISKLQQGENARAVAELEKAASLDTKSAQAGILLVMTHLRLKEYDKALAAAKTMEREQPDNPIVHNLKGGVYLGKKDVASARASFEKAVSLQPTYFSAIANLGQLDVQEKKPDAARKRFEALLEKDKKNVQAMTALANLASAEGKNDEARTWLERAVSAHPDAVQPAQLLVTHHIRAGDRQTALALANKLQNTHPDHPEFLDLLAQTQFASGDKAGALDSYGNLAVLMPDSAPVQFRIAAIGIAMQNDTAATAALKKAVRLDPAFVDAQIALAGIEMRKGNHDEALSIARQVQRQQAASPAGYALEGDVLMVQKKPAAAAKAYEQALALGRNGTLMTKVHGALVQAGNTKEADLRLAQWLKEHPADSRTRMYLAELNLMTKQYKTAIAQFQAILQSDPKNAVVLNNLAWAYAQEKDPRGLEFAEKAHQLAPDNPAIMDTLGWMLVEKGDAARGLPLLQKAASLAPEALEIRYHLVLALVKSGDKPKARTELEQLLATGKSFSKLDEAKALMNQL
ncbi:PEP-CTERM system TPR-repeat protein PrsT [Noviherbaspirillum cavernae]|uniref:PEP-CTERM system TPR-repeat protein PrsT n=1 Tax=Noviherbaspirillum cavernae TaxID=2320862 RepID=A0A418X3K8_9BURK|nr:XrtA/PEP-CTERM system TPR-repeat protein PrsT [Noviherbaspirillum cavernae]RJG07039.1 PEP-CTERM system TPR-repeat protein PrsT [Noviherbaspirillum cavernae]